MGVSPELDAVLTKVIERSRGAKVLFPQRESAYGPMVTDWMFRDEAENMHFFEVVGGTPTLRNLAFLTLLRAYHKNRAWGQGEPGYWLAAKSFPSVVKQVAKDVGVELVQIPDNVHVSSKGAVLPSRLGVTSPKAWSVLYHLLLGPAGSINELSKSTGVSYAWTHKLVTGLVDQGVLIEKGGYIEIDSMERVLDLVVWERPMKGRQVTYLRTDQPDAHYLAQAMAADLVGQKGFAFTGPMAASWRSRAHRPEGRLDVYMMDSSRIHEIVGSGEGVGIHVYQPDRDLVIENHEGIPVVSESQLVLDLAGFGPMYHDHLSMVLADARSTR